MIKEIDHSERRFGVIAVEEGFISPAQLFKAMATQVEDDLNGRPHRLIGEILQQQGTMTWAEVGIVLMALGTLKSIEL
jgi:hypothetical protein